MEQPRRWGLRAALLTALVAVATPGVLRGVTQLDHHAEWTDGWTGGGCACAHMDRNLRECRISDDDVIVALWEPVQVRGTYTGAAGKFALFVSPEKIKPTDMGEANLALWYGMQPGEYRAELGYLLVRDGFPLPSDGAFDLEIHGGAALCSDGEYYLSAYQEGLQEWDVELDFEVFYDARPGGGCLSFDCGSDDSWLRDDDSAADDDDDTVDDDDDVDDDTADDDDVVDDDTGDDDSAGDDDTGDDDSAGDDDTMADDDTATDDDSAAD
jgi:hypothetical protein